MCSAGGQNFCGLQAGTAGKLIAAGYWWASDDTKAEPQETAKTDAELFGIKPLPSQPQAEPEPEQKRPNWYTAWIVPCQGVFYVWHCAWPAFEIFIGLQTQCRHNSDGITGLDYSAVIDELALMIPGKTNQREIYQDIKALELGMMTAINERRQKAYAKMEADRNKGKK